MKRALLALICFLVAAPFAMAAGRHADAALEATLPSSLGGVALTIESQHGTELGTNSAAFDTFLATLGKARGDFTLASAYATGTLKAAVGCWRVVGANASGLMPAFKAAIQASSNTPLTIADETYGSRSVVRIGDPGQLAQGPLYAYVKGDTIYFVQTPEPRLAEEAVGKLPPPL